MVADSIFSKEHALKQGDRKQDDRFVNNPGLVSYEKLIEFSLLKPEETDPVTGEVITYKDFKGQLYSEFTTELDDKSIKILSEASDAGYLLPVELENELAVFSPYKEIAGFKSESTSTYLVGKAIQRLANETQGNLYDGKISLNDLVNGTDGKKVGLFRVFEYLAHDNVLEDAIGHEGKGPDGKGLNLKAVVSDPDFAALIPNKTNPANHEFDVSKPEQLSALTNLVLKAIHQDNLDKPYSQDLTLGKQRSGFQQMGFKPNDITAATSNYIESIDDEGSIINYDRTLPVSGGNKLAESKGGHNRNADFHFANKLHTDALIEKAGQVSTVICNMDARTISSALGVNANYAKAIKARYANFACPDDQFPDLGQDPKDPMGIDIQAYWSVEKTEYIREFGDLVKHTNMTALYENASQNMAGAVSNNELFYLMWNLERAEEMNGAILPYEKIIGKTNEITQFLKDNSLVLNDANPIEANKNGPISEELFNSCILAMGERIGDGTSAPQKKLAASFESKTDLKFSMVNDFIKNYYNSHDKIEAQRTVAIEINAQWLHDYMQNTRDKDDLFGMEAGAAKKYPGDFTNPAFIDTYNKAKAYVAGYDEDNPDKNNGAFTEISNRLQAFDALKPSRDRDGGQEYQLGIREELDRRAVVFDKFGASYYNQKSLKQINDTFALYTLKNGLNTYKKEGGVKCAPPLKEVADTLEGTGENAPELEENFTEQLSRIALYTNNMIEPGTQYKAGGATLDKNRNVLKAAGLRISKNINFDGTVSAKTHQALKTLQKGLSESNAGQYEANCKKLGFNEASLNHAMGQRQALYNKVSDLLVIYDQYAELSPIQKRKISAKMKQTHLSVKREQINEEQLDVDSRKTRGGPNADGYSSAGRSSGYTPNAKTWPGEFPIEVYNTIDSGVDGKPFGRPGEKLSRGFLEKYSLDAMLEKAQKLGIPADQLVEAMQSGKLGHSVDTDLAMNAVGFTYEDLTINQIPEKRFQYLLANGEILEIDPDKIVEGKIPNGMYPRGKEDGTIGYYSMPGETATNGLVGRLQFAELKKQYTDRLNAAPENDKASPTNSAADKRSLIKNNITEDQNTALSNDAPNNVKKNTLDSSKPS